MKSNNLGQKYSYQTIGNITVEHSSEALSYPNAIEPLIDKLDEYRGALFTSGFEYPGRYTRWDIGFINPPLAITAKGRNFFITALNQRGELLLLAIKNKLNDASFIEHVNYSDREISGSIIIPTETVPEEFRSKQPSIFSLLRTLVNLFYSREETHLGLFGAFGYDLVFQFERLKQQLPRMSSQRDLVLYLPDEIYIVDHQREQAYIKSYEFSFDKITTAGLARDGIRLPYHKNNAAADAGDHKANEYINSVENAKKAFQRGDLFEVVLSQTFYRACNVLPSVIFRRLRKNNPAPYASFINLGDEEYLVGASPEMFVRIKDKRVESCPISGTIARGSDAISDASQILTLLNSNKDRAELTMCTDVDRNDKSRICEPGSVKVIGRRQIEMYSRLIHTVDHVEGVLRDGFDAIDAFLSHTWVVTVTGAPKIWAMQFIENHEKTPRRWYGGAIGWLQFNGDINSGLTLRTLRIDHGIAEMRVGATLLFDSDPKAEEEETLLKASAFIDAVTQPLETPETPAKEINIVNKNHYKNKHILLVDHQDSFVHTLANYLRQTGAAVTTLRSGFSAQDLKNIAPDLLVLSPGPGCPKDFNVASTITMALDNQLPIFGVCLGLQALVEYFGGELNTLDYPMHGKASNIQVLHGKLFHDLPTEFTAGRYHSLYANKEKMPAELMITAESEDGIIMAIEHKNLPIAAVQFHPESILSLDNNIGLKLIFNVLQVLTER